MRLPFHFLGTVTSTTAIRQKICHLSYELQPGTVDYWARTLWVWIFWMYLWFLVLYVSSFLLVNCDSRISSRSSCKLPQTAQFPNVVSSFQENYRSHILLHKVNPLPYENEPKDKANKNAKIRLQSQFLRNDIKSSLTIKRVQPLESI